MRLLNFEISKFTMVGGANFVLTLTIYAGAISVFHSHYLVALATAWIAGSLFSYTANVLWVFRRDDRRACWASFFRYAFSSGASVTINGTVLAFVVEHFALDPFVAQLLLIPFVIAFNFLATKYWALQTRENTPTGLGLG